jgi:hypothetical protein
MSSSGPLSHGQLSLWRDIQNLPRPRWHEVNLAVVWNLPRGTAPDTVRETLEYLRTKHVSLRTVYDLDDIGKPVQRPQPPETAIPLEVSEGTGEDAARTALAMAVRPFDLTTEFGWRAQAFTRGGEATHLVFSHHHLASDNWSQGILREEFEAVLAHGVPAPTGEPYSLVELADEQRNGSFKGKAAAAERHWEKVLTTSAATLGDGRYPVTGEPLPAVQGSLRSAQAQAAAEQLAGALTLPKASVLLTAYALAAAEICGLRYVPVRLQSANRIHPVWGKYVTSMNQWAAACLEVEPGREFAETAAAFHKAAFQGYRCGMYDPDALAELKRRLMPSQPVPEPVWAFNYMSRIAENPPAPSDAEPTIAWDERVSAIGPRFYSRFIEDGSDELTIWLRGRDADRGLVSELLFGLHDRLIAAGRALGAGGGS